MFMKNKIDHKAVARKIKKERGDDYFKIQGKKGGSPILKPAIITHFNS